MFLAWHVLLVCDNAVTGCALPLPLINGAVHLLVAQMPEVCRSLFWDKSQLAAQRHESSW